MSKFSYLIPNDLIDEAMVYAKNSRAFTSNRHDFHSGGLDNKQQKMFEGKLGEKAFKLFLIDNNFSFIEDHSSPEERDEYDFILQNNTKKQLLIDVKTRTKRFHIRTLEMVEQYTNHPKDIYVSARLYEGTYKVDLLGWYTGADMFSKHQIENNGYLDNYVMYDKDLRPMESFLTMYSDYIL